MAGILPSAGVASSATINGTNATTTNCDDGALFYSVSNCQPRFDPAAMNAMISEVLNLVNEAGNDYDCSRLDNLATAVRAIQTPETAATGTVVPAGGSIISSDTGEVFINETGGPITITDPTASGLDILGLSGVGIPAGGQNGQVLTSNGSGGQTWEDPQAGISYQVATTAPTTRADGDPLEEGDLWYDSSNDTLNHWDGTAWVPVSNAVGGTSGPSIQVAAAAPTTRGNGDPLEEGDLYYNTGDDIFYGWDGAAWQPIGPAAGATGSDTQAAAAAPTTRSNGTPLAEGDLWFDTANDRAYGWDGTEWVSVGQPDFDYQNTDTAGEPTVRSDGSPLEEGDLWWDNEAQIQYTWDDTANQWVPSAGSGSSAGQGLVAGQTYAGATYLGNMVPVRDATTVATIAASQNAFRLEDFTVTDGPLIMVLAGEGGPTGSGTYYQLENGDRVHIDPGDNNQLLLNGAPIARAQGPGITNIIGSDGNTATAMWNRIDSGFSDVPIQSLDSATEANSQAQMRWGGNSDTGYGYLWKVE